MADHVTDSVTADANPLEVNLPKSMLGAGFGPAPLEEGRDFKSTPYPIVAGNNYRSRGGAWSTVAHPDLPGVTEKRTAPTRLKSVLWCVVEGIEASQ
jgi:hypothetical protein